MTTREKIEVMKAFERGGTIEMESIHEDEHEWSSLTGPPLWNWADYVYRVKKPTWVCSECQEVQLSDIYLFSKYGNGIYCSVLCADVADHRHLHKIMKEHDELVEN